MRPPPNWGIAHPGPPNAWGVTGGFSQHAQCNTCGHHQSQAVPPVYYGAPCPHSMSIVGAGVQWNPAASTCRCLVYALNLNSPVKCFLIKLMDAERIREIE